MKQFLLQTSFDIISFRFWRLETEKRTSQLSLTCDFCKILTSCFSFAWLACKTFQAMAVTAKRSKRANYYKTFFSILAMHVACHVPKSCILHMLCSQSPLLWSQDTICNLTEWKALIFIHFHVLIHFWYIDSSRNIMIF